jgi:Arc/MetJ-type ribon-helix-helix transcriptional regulator
VFCVIKYFVDVIKMKKQSNNIEVITVRIPKEITNILDSLIKSGIYNSRSEAIREFLREFALEHKDCNINRTREK